MTERVAVVGGGALGVTAAHDLAVRDVDVTLYEQGDLAGGASGKAAGICYDAFAEDTDAMVADRSVERFRELGSEGAIDFTDHEYVWFARDGDDQTQAAIEQQVERMQVNDRDVDLVDVSALADRYPDLDTSDIACAAISYNTGYLEPGEYVRAMADRAREAGATIQTDTRVELAEAGPVVETPNGTESFDAVLVAAGAHSKRLLGAVGISIAMKPYRVQALATGPVDVEMPIVYDASEGYYFRPRRGGLLVGDGTEEREFDPDDYDPEADDWFVEDSLDRIEHDAGVRPDVDRAWAGLCMATPDHDPLLGPVADGLYLAAGWQGHGFMRSPGLGEIVAEQMLGGDGIEHFDPRRFDGDEEFAVVEGMNVEE